MSSGRKLAGAVLLAGAAIPALCGTQAVSWAHQNGTLQSNDSITIKSQSGSSYGGQVNPAGAVAKANQSAVTQPPTVIIQATGGAYSETIPLLAAGTSKPPNCPSGFNSVWTTSGWGSPEYTFMNVAGSRWSLGTFSTGGYTVLGWFADHAPVNSWGRSEPNVITTPSVTMLSNYEWVATLCSK